MTIGGIKKNDDFILVSYDVVNDPKALSCFKAIGTNFPIFRKLLLAFGLRPVITLVLVYLCVKGIAVTAFNLALLSLIRDGLGIQSSAQYQIVITVQALAWTMKPCLGLLSDSFPLFGYRKRYYLTISAVCCVWVLLVICFGLPPSSSSPIPSPSPSPSSYSPAVTTQQQPTSAQKQQQQQQQQQQHANWIAVTFFLFLTNLCFADIDLLNEAVYTQLYLKSGRGRTGQVLVTLCWFLVMTAGVFAAPLVDIARGSVSTTNSTSSQDDDSEDKSSRPFLPLVIVALLVSTCIIPFYKNFYNEVRVNEDHQLLPTQPDQEEVAEQQREKEDQEREEEEEEELQEVVKVEDKSVAGRKEAENKDNEEEESEKEEEVKEPNEKEEQEQEEEEEESDEEQKRKLRKHAILMGIVAPVTAILVMLLEMNTKKAHSSSSTQQERRSEAIALALKKVSIPLASATILIVASFRLLPTTVAKTNLFMFLKEATYVSTAGALDFWYLAGPRCVPKGVHFSYTFYQTTTSVISSIFGGVGTWMFYRFFSKMNFQKIFLITTLLKIGSSFFDIFIVLRWNKSILGLSDKFSYFFGDAITQSALYSLDFLTGVVLTSAQCKPFHGNEAILYALLAGMSNLGQSLSGFLGTFLSVIFGIETSSKNHKNHSSSSSSNLTAGETATCNFDRLPELLLVAHVLLPLLCIPLIKVLVPSWQATVDENHEKDDDDDEDSSSKVSDNNEEEVVKEKA